MKAGVVEKLKGEFQNNDSLNKVIRDIKRLHLWDKEKVEEKKMKHFAELIPNLVPMSAKGIYIYSKNLLLTRKISGLCFNQPEHDCHLLQFPGNETCAIGIKTHNQNLAMKIL